MKIDVLYFEGCPNHHPAVTLTHEVLNELSAQAEVQEVEVSGPEDADQLRFLGSPTIQIDGIDVEPSARDRTDFGFSCRTYQGKGTPSRELLRQAIRDALQGTADHDQ